MVIETWRREYNEERPHEALGQRPPADLYTPLSRPFPDRPISLLYPDADVVRAVRSNGELRWQGRLVYVAAALAGQPVGLTRLPDNRWSVTFASLLLGFLDGQLGRVAPAGATRYVSTDD